MPVRKSISIHKDRRSKPPKMTRGDLKPVPVTLVSGFLGAGKTSLLRHILQQKTTKSRYCVIVNEISEFNVDAITIENGSLLETDEELVEMSNGCICCNLRQDLLVRLGDLYESGRFDRIIIESSGISEPIQVAETFFFKIDGKSLQEGIAPLTHCVSVVDASTIRQHIESNEFPEDGSVNDKDISTLLFDQLEFANVIVLNKLDLLSEGEKDQLVALIRKINNGAKIIPAIHSRVDLDMIVGERPLFDEKSAINSPGWMDDVINPKESESAEYGISSFSFKSDRPFHPTRLFAWITAHFGLFEMVDDQVDDDLDSDKTDQEDHKTSNENENTEETLDLAARRATRELKYGKVFRSKGFSWIASETRMGLSIGWSQAGDILNLNIVESWEHLSEEPAQRLIFIGQGLNKDALIRELNELLLTDEKLASVEATLDSGKEISFEDPFAQMDG